MRFIALVILSMSISAQAIADSPDRLIWDRYPLSLVLPVGAEKIITFPQPTMLYLPEAIAYKMRTQFVGPDAYLYVEEPFEATRVVAEAADGSGRMYLFDISAVKGASDNRVIVMNKPEQGDDRTDDQGQGDGTAYGSAKSLLDHYKRLARFASHQAYAPARLITPDQSLRAIPVKQRIVPIYEGSELQLKALAQWKNISPPILYVTILEAKNTMSTGVDVDQRNLKGRFLAAIPQHTRLGPNGAINDTSAIYVISDIPFDEAIQRWVATN